MRNIEYSFSRWGMQTNRFKWMCERGFGAAWVLLAGGFAIAQPVVPAVAPVQTQTVAAVRAADAAGVEEMPDRIIVLFRNNAVADDLKGVAGSRGAVVAARVEAMGFAVINARTGDGETLRQTMAARADVAYAVHDRVIHGAALHTRSVSANSLLAQTTAALPDGYYTASAQDWAVKQAGGFGAGVAGAPAKGPWNTTMGKGVRIAMLDSGVDRSHPDIAPNLVSASTLIDQTALPSPCDDGSAQDQAGHGTWAASLAVGAMGPHTGMMVGVAPEASLISIKVLERVPAAGTGSTASLCNAGTTAGLLSWIITGMADATAAHADIISISAGALLDTWSGYDAGQIALFNRAAYQAEQAGAVVIAAIGNDGEDLDNGRYVEMPAQATGVLPVMAATNPACGQDLTAGASCVTAAPALAYYSNHGSMVGAIAAAGGSYPENAASATGVTGFVRGACSMGVAKTSSGLPGTGASSFGCFDQGHVQYVEAIGTSAAAPLVAGAAALLKAANPKLTNTAIVALLQKNAQISTPGTPMIDTVAALSAAR